MRLMEGLPPLLSPTAGFASVIESDVAACLIGDERSVSDSSDALRRRFLCWRGLATGEARDLPGSSADGKPGLIGQPCCVEAVRLETALQ